MPTGADPHPALGEAATRGADLYAPGYRTARRPPGVKVVTFGLVLSALLGVLALAAVREVASPARQAAARPALVPPRPPLTVAEEEYALALWPIHNEVKAGALKMTLGGMSYKIGELDRAGLKARIEKSEETYREAARRIAQLTPPPSLVPVHEMYRDAVRLYQRSAVEMALVIGDGRDEHLVVAQPFSMEASEKLLKVGDVLWPNEYKPN